MSVQITRDRLNEIRKIAEKQVRNKDLTFEAKAVFREILSETKKGTEGLNPQLVRVEP